MYCPRVGLAYCVLLQSSLWVVVCGRPGCDLVDVCGGWREKKCESSLGDNNVNYNGIIMLDVLYLLVSGASVYLYIFWLGCVHPWWYCVSFLLMCIFNTVTGGVNVHYNHLSVCPLYHFGV